MVKLEPNNYHELSRNEADRARAGGGVLLGSSYVFASRADGRGSGDSGGQHQQMW